MKIGGIQPFSLIDFPKKISCVLFTQGCPFACHFCHNPSLVEPSLFQEPLFTEKIFSFLKSRQGKLDGVVISGGEPTSQPDLIDFIIKIKNLGFLVKLDTSGIQPDVLINLFDKDLIDYVAMDIKAPLEKYHIVTQRKIDTSLIEKSISLIKEANVGYEFRTTLLPSLHTHEDVLNMAQLLQGASLYTLQNFVPTTTLNPDFQKEKSFTREELLSWVPDIEKYVQKCAVR